MISNCTSLSTKSSGLNSKIEAQLDLYKASLQMPDKSKACENLLSLSKENQFPLHNLAQLRAKFICENPMLVPDLSTKTLDKQTWLRPLDLEWQVRRAELENDNLGLAKALFTKGQRSAIIRDKVNLYLRVLETLKKNKSNEAILLTAEVQSRLEKLAPRFIPQPKFSDYFAVGVDLIYQREFDKGRNYLWKVFRSKKSDSEQKYQALRAIRNSYKTQQDRKTHVTYAEELARWSEKKVSPSRLHEALLTLARAQWTLGNTTACKKNLDRAEKLLKNKYPLDEIYFVRGKMAEEVGDHETAIKHYAIGEKFLTPKAQYRERILFAKAWSLRKLGRFAEAVESFNALIGSASDDSETYKQRYWLGRTYTDLGDDKKAKEQWETLSEIDPLGYYGLLAYREMRKDLPPLDIDTVVQQPLKKPSSVKTDDHYLILSLIFADEKELLESFLHDLTADLKSSRESDVDTWFYYLKSYAHADLYLPLFTEIGKLPSKTRDRVLARHPDLLFPTRYADLIRPWSDKFKIYTEFVLAIIRQESAFNPEARSPADAMGLMQLLPSVARAQSATVGIPLKHFEDLFEPEVNVAYGSALIDSLKRKYDGQFLLMAAAYNANDRAIRGWLKTRLKKDPIEFIEDVPYEETRAYMKLVLRNFIFYSRLNNPSQKYTFPHWVFDGLHQYRNSLTKL